MTVLANEIADDLLPGLKVRVYYNFNRKCWSIQHKGLVVKHARSVTLEDVSFLVQAGGYARFQYEKVKNVHAFVCGTLKSINDPPPWSGTEVKYNPNRGPNFSFYSSFNKKEMALDGYMKFKGAYCAQKSVLVTNYPEQGATQ